MTGGFATERPAPSRTKISGLRCGLEGVVLEHIPVVNVLYLLVAELQSAAPGLTAGTCACRQRSAVSVLCC